MGFSPGKSPYQVPCATSRCSLRFHISVQEFFCQQIYDFIALHVRKLCWLLMEQMLPAIPPQIGCQPGKQASRHGLRQFAANNMSGRPPEHLVNRLDIVNRLDSTSLFSITQSNRTNIYIASLHLHQIDVDMTCNSTEGPCQFVSGKAGPGSPSLDAEEFLQVAVS